MKNDLPFDQFVKEQFSNSHADVPERIWENIKAARRSSRPKGFWFILSNNSKLLIAASVILMGLIGGYMINFSSNHSKSIVSNPVSGSNPVANQSLNTNPVIKPIAPDNNFSDNNILEKSNSNTNIGKVANNKNEHLNNQSNISPKTSRVKFGYLPGDNSNTYTLPGMHDSKATEVSHNVINPNEANKELINSIPTSEENKHFFVYNTSNNAREIDGNKQLSQKTVRFPDCPTLEKNAAGNKKFWEVYAGPDYVFNNYKTYGDTASYNYLQKRKASTQFTSAFSAGVRYTRVFENAMSIRTGLNYSQVNEKFSYVNPNELKFITVITRRVVVRSAGDTLYFNDTLQYQQTGTHVKTTYNHYRNVDIPLVMGYEVGNGKIHANINAGVIINLYSWYKGDVLDTSYQPISITTGKGSPIYQYKTNIGVGFLGSVSLYYKITDKMHIVLEPYIRYNLSPMSKENLNLQQKDHTIGLRTGLRFDLQ